MNTAPDKDFIEGSGLNAQAQQNPFYGYNSFLDRITGGMTGAAQPCLVLLDPARITVQNVIRMAAPEHANQIANIPGSDADYLKIVTLHELEHCRHVTSVSDPLSQEYYSDRRALQKFLDDGGDADVVRTWIGVRSAATLMNFLRYAGAGMDDPYTMGPLLYDEFVLRTHTQDVDLQTLKTMQTAYDEVASELLRRADRSENGATWSLRDPKFLLRLTKKILNDPSAQISDAARKLLELTKDSYEFLLRPQHKAMPQPTPHLPAIS